MRRDTTRNLSLVYDLPEAKSGVKLVTYVLAIEKYIYTIDSYVLDPNCTYFERDIKEILLIIVEVINLVYKHIRQLFVIGLEH